jgi:hypothetical protein
MTWEDWVHVVFGVIFIAIGLAFLLSPGFGKFAYESTWQGTMWKKLVGEKWAPAVAKFFFSFVSIAFGVWVIYSSIMGR